MKYFWVRAEVYEKKAAKEELRRAREMDPKNARKTRKELGLKEFSEPKIQSSVLGVDLVITRSLIAKLLKVKDSGKYHKDSNNKTSFMEAIKKNLYESEKIIKEKSKRLNYTKTFKTKNFAALGSLRVETF